MALYEMPFDWAFFRNPLRFRKDEGRSQAQSCLDEALVQQNHRIYEKAANNGSNGFSVEKSRVPFIDRDHANKYVVLELVRVFHGQAP